MRAVVQRVSSAGVAVDGQQVGAIGGGLLVLVGVEQGDGPAQARLMADKVGAGLRIFEDAAGKMNRSVLDVGGEVLAVSQFTLCGDCTRGRRPSFTRAAPPEQAEGLYEEFVAALRREDIAVATGRFRARMAVQLVNDGPVTFVVDVPPSQD